MLDHQASTNSLLPSLPRLGQCLAGFDPKVFSVRAARVMRLAERAHLGEQVSPAVPLEGGDGDVERVGVWQAVSLVDEPAWEVEQVPGLQDHLQHWAPDL